MISLIAHIGENLELGIDNHLIWQIKEDMQYFKETTLNHKVIMGLNTYLSIGKPLPHRQNIVLTTHPYKVQAKEVKIYDNITDLMAKEIALDEEAFVIGGSKVYQEFLPYAQKLYLTEVMAIEKKADVYFPKIDFEKWHKKVIKKSEENGLLFQFVIYERKNNANNIKN